MPPAGEVVLGQRGPASKANAAGNPQLTVGGVVDVRVLRDADEPAARWRPGRRQRPPPCRSAISGGAGAGPRCARRSVRARDEGHGIALARNASSLTRRVPWLTVR